MESLVIMCRDYSKLYCLYFINWILSYEYRFSVMFIFFIKKLIKTKMFILFTIYSWRAVGSTAIILRIVDISFRCVCLCHGINKNWTYIKLQVWVLTTINGNHLVSDKGNVSETFQHRNWLYSSPNLAYNLSAGPFYGVHLTKWTMRSSRERPGPENIKYNVLEEKLTLK